MDQATLPPEIVRKQRAHPRFGPIVSAASPLPVEALNRSAVAGFEEQARRHPDRLAVEAPNGSVTLEELNSAANRLAHYLLATGIDSDAPVGIILERSLDAVVSLLAVLKTGGYLLCLDPGLPAQHIGAILTRSGTSRVITTSAFLPHVRQGLPAECSTLLLDEMPAGDRVDNPGIPISPDRPAQLGVTSGSTGSPKLILKTHYDLLHPVWQSSNAYLLGPADRHASTLPFCTGTSVRALFGALLTGGAFHLQAEPASDLISFAAWIDAQALTQLYMPTAAFRELLRMLPEGPHFPSVRMVSVSGQTIYRQDAEMFQRVFPRGSIMACRYGMSETGSIAHYLVDHDSVLEFDTMPAGYPVPGREVRILDEEGRALGFNQPGEIAVRRTRLTSMPPAGQTATATRDGPAGEDDAPLVRTADLGLLRPDGCLILLGRVDDMVKVRGNRVALAEAEKYLLQVPSVAQAAVRAFATDSGDNRLVGYVSPAQNAQLDELTVREEMARLAPSYMVPARLVLLPTLPLTPTGKINRLALPASGRERPTLGIPMAPPSTPIEEMVAAIWRDVLDLDEIGVHDPFLDLGGDSLMAVRIVSRVEREFQLELPLRTLFEAPTVADMALRIAERQAAQLDPETLERLLGELEATDMPAASDAT